MYHSYKPLALFKKIDNVILYKHLGFSFFNLNDYLKNEIKSLKFLIFGNQLENVVINIDQKNLYNLELQRKNKLEGLNQNFENYSRASINFRNKNYDIKLRVKGDRALHFYRKDQTSYKIDLRGEDRIWGLEEFSVQKPITRNYIYEFIFHKFLEFNNLISLKYFFINLTINDTDQGIYAVEEGFSKELVERNKKRNGPIFGLEETKGEIYPNIEHDLYSTKYWSSNFPDLTNSALLKLEKIKQKNSDFSKYFDLNKWALYFAIIDLTQNYHGSVPKSVKLYYNPVTANFEPIGFDGHYNSNLFNDFILLDFLDEDNTNCDWICKEKDWFLKFLNNDEFLSSYKYMLKKISNRDLLNKFIDENSLKINFYNDQFLSETSKYDKVFRKGVGPYIYNQNYLINRASYIQSRLENLNEYDNKNEISNVKNSNSKNILQVNKIKKINEFYFLTEDLDINSNLYLPKGETLIIKNGVKINFKDDFIIHSNGSIFFEGTNNNPIIVSSENKVGSLILSDGNYKIKNVIFKNLSYPKVKDKILHSGINIINSENEIENVKIFSSNSEDSINIISSKSIINNLEISNSFADGIDIDFGTVNFNGIFCKDINNDCLDVSSAKVEGVNLKGKSIKDKGLSFGESSNGTIKRVNFKNSKLGIAVKDGSNLTISEYILQNNELDVATFNKKKEYEGAKLEINNSIGEDSFSYMVGKNNFILKNKIPLTDYVDNKIINEFLY
tara:strand:- start:1332 stop:3518 length:2187 start_codon:yes stop_codon:yes gene_type:complete